MYDNNCFVLLHYTAQFSTGSEVVLTALVSLVVVHDVTHTESIQAKSITVLAHVLIGAHLT